MRPLDIVRSIKVKLGLVVLASFATTLLVYKIGSQLPFGDMFRLVIAIAVGLVAVQLLATGMTSPLREMASAAAKMAEGDYSSRVTASARDEVGQLATAFNHMAEQLAVTDELRRELVANVSHELRTPVTGLQATLENLLDGVSEPDTATLALMHKEVERLGRLITQLLDLSQLESGASPITIKPFELEPLVETVVAEVSAQPSSPIDVQSSGAITAVGDTERIHQVVRNLLDNAVRHTPMDKHILVRLSETPKSTMIEVLDQGTGIAPEDRERVFERFVRADNARDEVRGGTGLGLSIVRWIVDLHGGRVWAEANEPCGTRMTVSLPKERP